MSLPASSRALRPTLTRLFTSSSAASAPADPPSTSKRPQARRQALGLYNIRYLEDFNFDDATSLGYLRLEKIRESQELVRKVELDREVLAGEREAVFQRLEHLDTHLPDDRGLFR
jgi:small subunit ribosomal protein S35